MARSALKGSSLAPPSRTSLFLVWLGGFRVRLLDSVATFGGTALMTSSAVRLADSDVRTGTLRWADVLRQSWFIVSVTLWPTLLVAIPFGVTISIQVGGLAEQVGATSFMGAANGIAAIREGAPMVTAILLAGAAGSAICSDLAARTIREEVDALEVMGVSPIRRLVVPRLIACVLVGTLLVGIVAFTAIATGFVFNVTAQDGTPGSYIESFAAFAQIPDLILAIVKAVIFSFVVATVASYKGLTASGGPKGVAQAVNATVVLSVVLLFVINLAITQVYAVYFPPRIV